MQKWTVRIFLGLLTISLMYVGVDQYNGLSTTQQKNLPQIVSYRSASCGCCKKWVDHIQENGFQVKDHVVQNIHALKDQMNVPTHVRSCHTAIIDGYVIEGHVPATDIKKLLKERINVAGIAVPRMPVGTPGMEMGNRKDPFEVVSFNNQGQTEIFNRYH